MIDIKKIGILGAAKSGVSASKLALKMGFKVILSDIDKNKKIDIDSNNDLTIELGEHSDLILDSDIVIISPGINPKLSIIEKINIKKIPIISEIEFASWFTSSDILAITGSNGKSTTVSILHEIFLEAKYDSLLGGNIGIPFSSNVLLESKSKKINKTIHIVELSSFQIEKLDSFKAKIACILNISEDHLDRYENMDEYVAAKLKLVNHSSSMLYNSGNNLLNVSLDDIDNANALADNKYFYISDQSVYEKDKGDVLFNLNETNLIGKHNLENAFSAAVISRLYGVENKFIRKAILAFKPLPHRLELIDSNSDINCYNDSKSTNIKSTLKALQSFRKDVFLILGGRDKGSDFSDLASSLDPVEKIFCYGECGKNISSTLKKYVEAEYIGDFNDCVASAIESSQSNQNILLSPACSSYDQFDNYEERGNVFKNIVSRML